MNNWKTIVVFFIGIGVGVGSNYIVQQQTAYASATPTANAYIYRLVRYINGVGYINSPGNAWADVGSAFFITNAKCQQHGAAIQKQYDAIPAVKTTPWKERWAVSCIRLTPTAQVGLDPGR